MFSDETRYNNARLCYVFRQDKVQQCPSVFCFQTRHATTMPVCVLFSDETRYNNARLCLVILTCVAEDQYANSLMHDINMNFRVPLHRLVLG